MPRKTRPASDLEQLPTPPARVKEVMAAHLRQHGLQRFSVSRHVHLGGERRRSQRLTWNPTNATFRCVDCPGRVFVIDEITDEMVRRAQLYDSGLHPHLAGLTAAQDRDEMTRLYLKGTLNEERLRGMRAGAHRRAAASSRPSVDRRRQRLNRWMLERYAELGIVERVLDAVEEMQLTDQVLWTELVGRPLARSTIKGYWYDIDPDERAAAKQRFESRS